MNLIFNFIAVLIAVCVFCKIVEGNNKTSEDKLRHDLLPNYVKTIIPVEHNEAMNISLILQVNHFDIDEVGGKSVLYGSLNLHWIDRKLRWNKELYDNLDTIYLTSEEVWLPDVALYNNAQNNVLDVRHKGHVKVESSGSIQWIPQVKLESFCDLQLKNWPFDSQTCTFVMGSWVHHGFQLNLQLPENQPLLHIFSQNHQWKIIDMHSFREEKVYACCVEPYPTFTFTFDLKRTSPMLCTILLLPGVCIILMCLAVFWLPPNRNEKILLNGINLLLVALYMYYFEQKIPAFSNQIPFIVIFYSATFVLSTISMILSVAMLALTKSYRISSKLPQVFKNILQSNAGQALGVSHLGISIKDQTELKDHFEDGKSGDDNLLIRKQQQQDNFQDDWIMLATAIDRIFFYLYVLTFVVLILICFI